MNNQTDRVLEWVSRHKLLTGFLAVLVLATCVAICDDGTKSKPKQGEGKGNVEEKESTTKSCSSYCSLMVAAAGSRITDPEIRSIISESYGRVCLRKCHRMGVMGTNKYILKHSRPFCKEACYEIDAVRLCYVVTKKNKHRCHTRKMRRAISRLFRHACLNRCGGTR